MEGEIMITIEDILKIDNTDIFFFDHYKEDKPNGQRLFWGELYPLEKATNETIQDRLTNPEWKNNDLYLIPKYMQYGDYDDSCMVERSNYKIFLEDYGDLNGVYTISGGYGSSGIALSIAWLINPDNEEKAQSIIDQLNALNDYPCIDDEEMSRMEYEAFIEALSDYGISDTCSALASKYGITVYDYNEEKMKELILDVDRHGNEVYIIESGGSCYINIDDEIVPKITKEQFLSVLTDYEVIES
jgi:hypothetical protein